MSVEWQKLLIPQMPFLEVMLRGTLVYLVLFALMRVILKRNIGALSITDLLMVVLVGNAATNALSGSVYTITDGVFVCAVIILWNFVLEWLSVRSALIRRWTQPPPVMVIRDGRILYRNLRHERISEQELMSRLRQHGLEHVEQVKVARVEEDGKISVIGYD